MGNILVKVKRFFQNKNTVTILCVLAGILVLYMGYNWRVTKATEPVSIPYAKTTLVSRHVITTADIGYVEVASSVLEKMDNVVRNSAQLVGKPENNSMLVLESWNKNASNFGNGDSVWPMRGGNARDDGEEAGVFSLNALPGIRGDAWSEAGARAALAKR